MTCHQGIALLIPCIVVAVVWGILCLVFFKKYCARIAEKEGRLEQYSSIIRGEIGLNSFEIEQFGKVWRRYYLKFGANYITAMGDKLLIFLIGELLISLSLVAMVAFVSTNCNA